MNEAVDQRAAPEGAGARAVPASRVDFDRPVVCILGLPFDAIGVAQAVQRIRDAAFAGRRCFVSTPNLNFAIAARSDAAFRGSVLRSDLSLVDGMPLVWIARWLGLPIRERVSGADVFDALQAHPGPALTVYVFGGPTGIAARACERINQRGGGIRCVGFDAPGFGSVESMSSEEQIARINDSGAHFVVVSLGAKKGQAWIEHNATRLTAPVLSHLGAVVNFAAVDAMLGARMAVAHPGGARSVAPLLERRGQRAGASADARAARCDRVAHAARGGFDDRTARRGARGAIDHVGAAWGLGS